MIPRPALRYYGGKFKVSNWIISFFPPHTNYLEPCGGAASILLQKDRVPVETFNDIDNRIVNYFQVLRESPENLIKLLRLTPWSREELKRAQFKSDSPIEDARRIYVLHWQSFSKPGGAWRCTYDHSTRPRNATQDMIDLDFLYKIAGRLQEVQLENKDYKFETNNQFHIDAGNLLNRSKSYVVVSGYKSGLYKDLYEKKGWIRFDKSTVAQAGAKRTESVWLSPRTFESFKQQSGYLPGFDERF